MLIDTNLKAWLLEINAFPGMDFINCRKMLACDHRFCPRSPVDNYVKKKVLNDVLSFMLLQNNSDENQSKEAIDALNNGRFKSFARIFPSNDVINMKLY